MFPVVSQTIAAAPPLLSIEVAYRKPKTDLTRGVSQKKLASEAYRSYRGRRTKQYRRSRYSGVLRENVHYHHRKRIIWKPCCPLEAGVFLRVGAMFEMMPNYPVLAQIHKCSSISWENSFRNAQLQVQILIWAQKGFV